MGTYTVSFQVAKTANQAHNRRDPETIARQNKKDNHIDLDLPHEDWVDMTETEGLHQILDEPIKRYNDNQKRADRRTTFDKEVGKFLKKGHTKIVEEAILEVGNAKEHPPERECRRILHHELKRFQKANPNLLIIGAYYHADEPNAGPHLHIDYIAYHKKRARGIDTQLGITGALEDMGYANNAGFATREARLTGARAQWANAMHELCRESIEELGYETKKGAPRKKEKGIDIHEPTPEFKERLIQFDNLLKVKKAKHKTEMMDFLMQCTDEFAYARTEIERMNIIKKFDAKMHEFEEEFDDYER